MKILLNSAEKKAFLQAAVTGYLDTESVPELIERLQDGKNAFFEVMKQLPDNPESISKIDENGKNQIVL